MKIHENPETGEFAINPESKEEAALFKLLLSMAKEYPRRELDMIKRQYEKIQHCNHHFGLGHEVACPHCKGIVNRKVNYKCGLPKGHEGDHCYILNWDELEGMHVLTGDIDGKIIV